MENSGTKRRGHTVLTAANSAVLVVAAFGLGGCGLGMSELLIILAIVVLLFGATRLPQLGRALGQTVKGFKEASGNDEAAKVKAKDDGEIVRIDDAQVERDEPKKLEDNRDA